MDRAEVIAMNAAIHHILVRDEFPPRLRAHPPTHPWATNLLAALDLIDTWVLCSYPPPVITLTLDRLPGRFSDMVYTCHIQGEDWYCEAEGKTLAEAICRAFIQELETS